MAKITQESWDNLSESERATWKFENPAPTKEAWKKMSQEEHKAWEAGNAAYSDINSDKITFDYIPGNEPEAEQKARLNQEGKTRAILAAAEKGDLEPLAAALEEQAEKLRGAERFNAEKLAEAASKELKDETKAPETRVINATKAVESAEAGRGGNSSFGHRVRDVLKAASELFSSGISYKTVTNFLSAAGALLIGKSQVQEQGMGK